MSLNCLLQQPNDCCHQTLVSKVLNTEVNCNFAMFHFNKDHTNTQKDHHISLILKTKVTNILNASSISKYPFDSQTKLRINVNIYYDIQQTFSQNFLKIILYLLLTWPQVNIQCYFFLKNKIIRNNFCENVYRYINFCENVYRYINLYSNIQKSWYICIQINTYNITQLVHVYTNTYQYHSVGACVKFLNNSQYPECREILSHDKIVLFFKHPDSFVS